MIYDTDDDNDDDDDDKTNDDDDDDDAWGHLLNFHTADFSSALEQ